MPDTAARRSPTAAYPGSLLPRRASDATETAELAFDSRKEVENYKPRVVSRIKRGQSVKDQVRLDTTRRHPSATPVGNTRRSSRCSAFGVCPPRVEPECSFGRSYGYLRSDHGELDVCCNSMKAYTRRSLAEDLGC
jgi:hypothetical protein